MFNYLHGQITELNPVYCVIDCSGVGYEVEIPLSTYEKIRELKDVKLLIHYYQNDEGTRLFGFISPEEKSLFRQLISISRVGPKIALSMLSSLPVISIVNSILSDDYSLLAKVPGLGKKTAQRLIIELKDKVSEIQIPSSDIGSIKLNDVAKEAEIALLTLGYKAFEIRSTLQDIISQDASIGLEDLIKKSIKNLYKKG